MNAIAAEFFDFIKTGKTGCAFAVQWACRLEEGVWRADVVEDAILSGAAVETLNMVLNREAAAGVQAMTLIFPAVKTVKEVAQLIRYLCSHPRFYAAEIGASDEGSANLLRVGLRWILPDDRHVNWVLGFADLPSMPSTRRSPYTALVLRLAGAGRLPGVVSGDPNEARRRGMERGRIPVHLADMEGASSSDEENRRYWRITQQQKRRLLVGDPAVSAAKAKVTFALPTFLRTELSRFLTGELGAPRE